MILMLLSVTVSSLPSEHQRSGCSNVTFCYFAPSFLRIVVFSDICIVVTSGIPGITSVDSLYVTSENLLFKQSWHRRSAKSSMEICLWGQCQFSNMKAVCFSSIGDKNSRYCSNKNSKIAILCFPVQLLKPRQKLADMIVLIDHIQMQKVLIDCPRSWNTSAHHVPILINPVCFVVAHWLCGTNIFGWNKTQDLFLVVLVANH